MKNKTVTAELTIMIPILEDMVDFSPNVGALTLSIGERNFILDTVQTYRWENSKKGDSFCFEAKLNVDTETFEEGDEYNYLLTEEDLLNHELKGEYYCVLDDTGATNNQLDMNKVIIEGLVIVDGKKYDIKNINFE